MQDKISISEIDSMLVYCDVFAVEKKEEIQKMVYQIPPTDLNWMTTYLIVQDVEQALDFYCTVFLFDIHQTVSNRQGKIVFARIRYNGTNIILGPHDAFEGEKDYGIAPIVSRNPSPIGIYVYCNNLQERYEKALKVGIKVLIKPEKRFWGDTLFRVEDPNGYIWTFATPTHDFDFSLLPDELKLQ
jgi:PhnB protein